MGVGCQYHHTSAGNGHAHGRTASDAGAGFTAPRRRAAAPGSAARRAGCAWAGTAPGALDLHSGRPRTPGRRAAARGTRPPTLPARAGTPPPAAGTPARSAGVGAMRGMGRGVARGAPPASAAPRGRSPCSSGPPMRPADASNPPSPQPLLRETACLAPAPWAASRRIVPRRPSELPPHWHDMQVFDWASSLPARASPCLIPAAWPSCRWAGQQAPAPGLHAPPAAACPALSATGCVAAHGQQRHMRSVHRSVSVRSGASSPGAARRRLFSRRSLAPPPPTPPTPPTHASPFRTPPHLLPCALQIFDQRPLEVWGDVRGAVYQALVDEQARCPRAHAVSELGRGAGIHPGPQEGQQLPDAGFLPMRRQRHHRRHANHLILAPNQGAQRALQGGHAGWGGP